MDPEVTSFLTSLTDVTQDVVAAVRKVVRRVVPEAQESVAWGALSYDRPEVGGRVKGAVCLIVVKRGKVSLDFIHGVHLIDPAGLLRGRQASKRFVPIATAAEAKASEIADLIRDAAAFDLSESTERIVAPDRKEIPIRRS